jgi:hypothetical protein
MASSIVGSLAWGDLRGSATSSICCSVSTHEPEPPELEELAVRRLARSGAPNVFTSRV